MERRQYRRILFAATAELCQQEQAWACVLLDLSLKGALLKLPEGAVVEAGKSCLLTVKLDGSSGTLMAEGEISHVQDGELGLHFTRLDIHSATQLKRIVQLNLGNDEILHRELEALTSDEAH